MQSAVTKLGWPALGPGERESDAEETEKVATRASHWSAEPSAELSLVQTVHPRIGTEQEKREPRKVTSPASKYVRMMKGEKCNLLHNMYFNSSRISLEFHKFHHLTELSSN